MRIPVPFWLSGNPSSPNTKREKKKAAQQLKNANQSMIFNVRHGKSNATMSINFIAAKPNKLQRQSGGAMSRIG